MNPRLQSVLADLRNPMIDVADSEHALDEYILAQQAIAWHEGVERGYCLPDLDNVGPSPYGDAPACTCGFGGFHENINPRCERNQDLHPVQGNRP